MISEEKIKVFISSKCGGERINFDKLVDTTSKSKKDVAEKAIRTSYDLVRKALKLSLEETGFIKVYLFEDDLPSTSSAGEDYIYKIDESHVCLFLIDNFDEIISEGVLKEISRAKELNKKSIYLFLNDPRREITSIQENFKGVNGAHFLNIIDIRDFIDIGYHSVINDIVNKYQQYTRENIDRKEKAASPIEITRESFPTETMDIKKQIFQNLGLTKNRISGLIFNPGDEKVKSSDLDKSCLEIIEVLIGEKKFDDVNLAALLEPLRGIQSPELYEVVNLRWEAISSFYKSDIDNALTILESLYNKYSENGIIPKWLVNDILIDWRNINEVKNQANNIIFDPSIQRKIDQQDSIVFFPLIDRFSTNINDDIWDRNFNISTSSPYTSSFYGLEGSFGYISNYLFTAIYYGSLIHLVFTLKQIQKVLFDIVQIENNLLNKIQLMRMSILFGDENEFKKITDKYKSSLSHSTTREILDLYKLADTKPLPHQKSSWKLILFKEIGYYFSDIDYETISNEIIDYSHDLICIENPNFRLVDKLIEALKFNKDRLSKEKIVDFAIEVFNKNYYRFFDSIFDLLSKLNFRTMPQELLRDLLLQVEAVLGNEEIKQRILNIEKFFIRIRKSRDDFSAEIDEIVERHYPEFFKQDYHLEIYPIDRIIHIKRYLDSIKSRNLVQGKNGMFIGYLDNPYITIKNIIEHDKIFVSEELRDDLLKEIANTLFSETQTYTEKINSIQLLLCLKRQDLSNSFDWNNYYFILKQNITNAEKGNSIFFKEDSDLLLKLSLIILRITFGEDCLQEILEILAFINNGSNREIIESLIALEDFLKVEKNNLAENPIISLVVQYISAFCFHEDDEIRSCTVGVLYQLIDSKYASFVVNRLVKMMDDNDFKVKWAIVNQASLIKQHSLTSFNYIVGKAKIDNNYLVRKVIETMSEK